MGFSESEEQSLKLEARPFEVASTVSKITDNCWYPLSLCDKTYSKTSWEHCSIDSSSWNSWMFTQIYWEQCWGLY